MLLLAQKREERKEYGINFMPFTRYFSLPEMDLPEKNAWKINPRINLVILAINHTHITLTGLIRGGKWQENHDFNVIIITRHPPPYFNARVVYKPQEK